MADDEPVRLPPVLVDDHNVREPAGPGALHEVPDNLLCFGCANVSPRGKDGRQRAAAWGARGGVRRREGSYCSPRGQAELTTVMRYDARAGGLRGGCLLARACPPLLILCAFGKMSFSSFANAVRRLLGSLLVVTSTFGSSSPAEEAEQGRGAARLFSGG